MDILSKDSLGVEANSHGSHGPLSVSLSLMKFTPGLGRATLPQATGRGLDYYGRGHKLRQALFNLSDSVSAAVKGADAWSKQCSMSN